MATTAADTKRDMCELLKSCRSLIIKVAEFVPKSHGNIPAPMGFLLGTVAGRIYTNTRLSPGFSWHRTPELTGQPYEPIDRAQSNDSTH